MTHKAIVADEIFQKFPCFVRGIVIATGMDNRGDSEELKMMLEEALTAACLKPLDLKNDPRTALWNQAYRDLGCNPNKFPPAHISLLKRVQKQGARLPFINKAVSIMNLNSIKGIMPVGGDDLLQSGKRLELRLSSGRELFTPLNAPENRESPSPGEVVYVASERDEVMCRRWNWRNGFLTRVTEDTTAMLMNIDGLGESALEQVLPVRDRVSAMLEEYCGAETQKGLLLPVTPSCSFSV